MSSHKAKAPSQKIQSDFKLGVTKKARILAILPVVIATYMFFMGISAIRSFHPKDESRYLFGLPPLALSALILGLMATLPRKFCRGTVHVRDSGIEFNPGDHDLNVNFPWNDLVFSATQNKQQMIRSIILVHRDRKMVFYDVFTHDFDALVAAVSRRKTRSTTTAQDGGLRIDSGKIGQVDSRMTGR